MGTIAARDCLRVLELTEQVAAALTLASVQGVNLRQTLTEVEPAALTAPVKSFMQSIAEHSAFLDEDRPLEHELRTMTRLIRQGHWELYSNV